MSEASFTKNFKINKQNAEAFTKLMTDPAKPLLPHGFKSSFVDLKQHPKLQKEINEAVNNNNN